MPCPVCGLQIAVDDNYCRKCGTPLHIIDVPAVASESRAVTAWEEAKPAVARGMALLAAGAMLRYVIGWAGKAALARALGPALDAKETSFDPRRIVSFAGSSSKLQQGAEDVEILWYRRIRR